MPIICPSGFSYDGNQCTQQGTQSCPQGYSYNGTSCIQTGSLTCPAGFVLNSSTCTSEVKNCSQNEYWNGLLCIASQGTKSCAPGYTYTNNRCVYTAAGPTIYQCMQGYNWNGVTC